MKKAALILGFLPFLSQAQPCFPNPGTPAGSAINSNLQASRFTGVAPLVVYFDAGLTTASATTRPFHELSYCWDFGDPNSGVFSTNGKSKNRAFGPAAGHVFETPGIYRVVLTIRDSLNREAIGNETITVLDPDSVFADTSTRCFSISGDFTGCPAGASTFTITGLSAINSHVAPGRRLLFRRGDTIPVSLLFNAVRINVGGPGMIGAYGTGNPPLLRAIPDSGTAFAPMFRISQGGGSAAAFADWRIMDLDIDGMSDVNSEGIYVEASGTNLLVLRNRMVRIGTGIRCGGGTYLPGQNNGLIDVLAIQETELRDLVSTGNLAFLTGQRMLLLGNHFENSKSGEHVLRTPWINRGVLSHNYMGEENAGRHTLKLHAPEFVASAPRYTEWVVISDNIFPGTTAASANNWTVGIGPENEDLDERVRQLIVERNLFLESANEQVSLVIWAPDVTVRNNIFHRGARRDCMEIGRRDPSGGPVGAEPSPANVHLYHNTCYGTATVRLAAVQGTFTDIRSVNNFTVGPTLMAMGGLSVNAGNLTATNAAAAGFTSSAPVGWLDFRLTSSSPGVNTGVANYAAVWDYEGRSRDSLPDVGASEYAAGLSIRNARGIHGSDFSLSRTRKGLIISWTVSAAIPLQAELHDLAGKRVAVKPDRGPYWHLSGLPLGIYFLSMVDGQGLAHYQRLVVSR